VRELAVIPPGGGEVIGDSPERRVEILCDDDALHATWSRFGPGRDGADLHVHRRHTDLFFVLSGELTVRLGPAGDPVGVPAGALVRVPPLVVHGFRNAADAELRYLNFHTPGVGFADYMRALRDGRTLVYDQEDPPADGGRAPADAVIGGAEVAVDEPGLRTVVHAATAEIAVTETWAGPGGAPLPLPTRDGDGHAVTALWVIEGELELSAGEQGLRVPPGSWAHVPAGVPYGLERHGAEPLRFLSVRAPGGAS